MPVPSGFALVSHVFSGPAAGPGGCMSTIGIDYDISVNPTDAAAGLSEAFTTTLLEQMSVDVALQETRLRIGTPEGEIIVVDSAGAGGSAGGTSLPPNVAYPITKFSAFGGRANRGRMFLPGVPESAVDSSGAIDSDVVSDVSAAALNYMAAIADLDFTPVILHSDEELEPTVILAMLCGSIVFTRGTRLR